MLRSKCSRLHRFISGLFSFIITGALLTGCAQLPTPSVESARSILPVSDSAQLPDVIKTLLTQSDKQYLNNDLPGALATLERAIRINPRHAEVWSRMAQIYFKQGNLQQARQHAKRSNSVISNQPQLEAFNNRIIELNTGQPESIDAQGTVN